MMLTMKMVTCCILLLVCGAIHSVNLIKIRDKRQAFDLVPGIGKTLFYDESPLDSGIYNGDLKYRKPHGQGKIIYFVSDTYNRVNYTGNWKNGTRHGHGTTVWRDGKVYTGNYVDGWEEGLGRTSYPNGTVHEGEYSGGEKNGKGILIKKDGTRLKGVWKKNQLLKILSERIAPNDSMDTASFVRSGHASSRSVFFSPTALIPPEEIAQLSIEVRKESSRILKSFYNNVQN